VAINSEDLINFIFIFSASLVLSVALVFVRIGRGVSDLSAQQSSHTRPTSRLGGLSVVGAIFIGTWFWFVSAELSAAYQLFLIVSAPLFIAGLAEDFGVATGVRLRLLAAVVSGAGFVVAFGQWLPRLDVAILDVAMAWPVFAVPFTVVACAGVAHAFNLIDGINGLSSVVSIGACTALMAICAQVGLWSHFQALGLLLAAVAGFMVVNFPFGRLFLGDGGAYIIGHILVWTAVSVVWMSPDVSTFAVLLIFFWPIADTVLAIWRRGTRGRDMTQPDRLHFHQLVMRGLELAVLGRGRREIANPLATVVITPLAIAPMVLGTVFYNSHLASVIFTVFSSVCFVSAYFIGIKWAQTARRRM